MSLQNLVIDVSILKQYRIDHVYPLCPQNTYQLFLGESVTSCLWSDGIISEQAIRIDKYPEFYDLELQSFSPLKRYDFVVEDALFVCIDQRMAEKNKRSLYINGEYKLKRNLNLKKSMIQVEINEKELLKVKSLEY